MAFVVGAILLVRDGHEPPLKIVALGPRASGKTVLLSSMFVSLSRYAPPTHPYLLEADDPTQARELLAIDSQLRSAKQWPEVTPVANLREYDLNCVGRRDGAQRQRLFGIGYLDYGGESLNTARTDLGDPLSHLGAHVKQAGGLLGIIDGEKVVGLFHDDDKLSSDARDYFITRFDMIEWFLQVASTPFQLVVTKWDVVDRAKTGDARLQEVIEKLGEHTQIDKLVAGATANEIVRIIPVTAVGWNFADLGDDGASLKRGDGELAPWNVEVPLAALVIDRLTRIERSLEGRALDRLKWLIGRREWRSARAAAAKAALPTGLGAILPVVGTVAGVVFMDFVARKYELPPTVQNDFGLDDTDRARRLTVDHYHTTMMEFDKTFPSSVLRDG